ncbi:MAG: hypothetical protein IJR87_00295, partial [Bacteroidaceae bacterium]|nr:hypothetical protein [Bacteroidaceae bacterium]
AENFPGLTDGETTTKWCVRPYVKGDCYAIIKAGDPIRPTFYSLSTANDTQSNPGRNWKAWRIFAANFDTEEEATRESSKWQLIDTKTNIGTDQLPTTNYTTVYFYLDQAPAEGCTYFKIEVDEIASGDIMQMSEFQFFNQGNLMQLRNEYYELFESVFDLDEIVAQQSLVDEYRQKLSELQKVTNMNSMGTLHSRLTELKPLIEQSMAAYEAYIEAAEEAIQELDISTLTGPGAEFLKAYLEEDIAPDTPYPNGSYPYIMRTRALDVQTIQRETTYLRNLLEGALNGSAAALRGTAGYGPEEGPAALVDGNEATKWAGTFQDEAYIVFKTASPQQPFFYTLVTGNDANRYPGRNWKDWSIYGANFQSDDDAVRQAEAWTLIDQKTGIGLDRIPDTNFTPCWFGLSEQMTELYQYFMVVVTKVANGSAQQMSELTWGDEADFQDIKSAQYDAADYFLYQHELSEQRLQDTYQDKMEAMNDAQDMETFVSFLHEIQSLQSRLRVSNQTYQEYIALIDELRTFLKENEIDAPILDAYTSGSEEPNDLFPNGNYEYIIEIHELNQSDLVAEMERVKQMWADAIRQTDKSVEVTELLTNPTFANGFSGWEGQPGTETGSTNEGRPFAAISKNQAFNLHQQLTGLRNGYYMLTANALYRPHDEAISTDYAAFLYANEVVNYIQSACEDLVTDETAIDGENCYLASDLQVKDEYGEFIGYAPNSVRTMAYAIKGGRYQNAVLVQVTDGTLTVGLYDQGTIQGNDWTAFGNVRLYYLGSDGDEARMMDALSTYRARSESLLRYMPDVVDYKRYPNFSQELRDRLSALNRELDTSNGLVPDRLVAMAGEYAAIFQEIMDSKRAYVSLMNTAELLYARVNADDSGLSEEEINQVNELIPDVWEKWEDGAYTTEEAWQQSDLVDNNVYRRLFGTRPQMAGGIYQIGNPEELRWMAIAVNGGDNGISACLTSDIDLQTLESSLPVIGTNDNPFRGKFDGQGHAIHNFMLEATSSIAGLFGKIQNADVRSFSIDGQLTCISASNGPVAYADASTISDVHSSLNIVAIRPGVTHTGGIAGECQNGTIVSRCSYDGTMTVDGNNNDCFGGICGYTNTSRLDNCAFYGKLTFNNSGCFAGGILGYINNTSCQGPHNCLSVGQVQYVANIAIQPSYAGAIIGWMRGYNANLIGENWYLEGSAPAASGAATLDKFHAVNAQQMTSGQTCYLLNSGQAEQPWRQTLGQDDTPVLDQTHLKVYLASDGSYTNEETTTHSGTQDDPFVVKTASDLSNLRNLLVSGRMNYVVMEADVDMEGVTDWIPLFDIADQSAGYPFIDFDGKGHVILNLTSQDPTRWYNGLFGVLCGNVRNLGMENANILSEASGTGIISGYLGHSTYGKPCYVENVWATGNVKVTQGYCGGLFGTIADVSHIKNCYARVSVTGADGAAHTTGGIIGRVRGMVDMQNVYAAGTINQGGGIIGGGHADNTPGGTYNNIVVWNNTSQTFGNTIADDRLNGISYYDGSNFAQLQQTVVSWDSNVWFCDMAEGSYPVLAGFTGIGSVATQPDAVGAIYDLQGRHIVGKPVRGLYIINGRKMLVK